MGKSSLCVRTIQRLKAEGVRTVFLDLTKFGGSNLTPDQWYAALLSETGRELGLRSEFLQYFRQNSDVGPMQRYFGAIREVALTQSEQPIVIFVDEIDATRSLPFPTDEFFAGIRERFVARATDPVLSRLTFCLLGTATPAELIQDARITPFNIGKRIELRDFTPEEAAPLAANLPGGKNALERILFWTGGHPYLTQRLCRAAQETGQGADALASELFLSHSARESEANLTLVRDRLLRADCDQFALLSLYRAVRRGKRVADDETNPLCDVLKLSGIVTVEQGRLKVRNEIYRRVFDEKWIEAHLPGVEVRRQKEAFRRGQWRAFGLSGIVLALVGGLAYTAVRNADVARAETKRANAVAEAAERTSYTANMNLIQQNWENNNIGRVLELLNETKDYKDRGFEWGYWNRLCHLDLETRALPDPNNERHDLNAVSPDGKLCVTSGLDKGITIRAVVTGKAISTIKRASIYDSFAFSPDGRHLAVNNGNEKTTIWDIATGRPILTLKGSNDSRFAFSPDSKQIVMCDTNGVSVRDVKTGKPLTTIPFKDVTTVAFSPTGERIASAGSVVAVWDAKTGRKLMTLKLSTNFVRDIYFSSDHTRIAISNQEAAFVFDGETGKKLFTLNSDILTLAFSSDSHRIATGDIHGVVREWDGKTGREINAFKGHSNPIEYVAFSADRKCLFSMSGDSKIKTWDANLNRETLRLQNSQGRAISLEFSGDSNRILVTYGENMAKTWDAATGKNLLTLNAHNGSVNCGAFSPDGKRIVTGGADKLARVWNAVTGKELLTLRGHTDEVRTVAFSANGKEILTVAGRLFSDSQDRSVRVWDASSGKELRLMKPLSAPSECAAFSLDGEQIVWGGQDGVSRVSDTKTGKNVLSLDRHSQRVFSVTFSPAGDRIATASEDSTARKWDATTGKTLLTLKGHSLPLSAVTFSPDGTRILTSSVDRTTKLWDASTGKELLTFKGQEPYSPIAFSPDGKRIVTGDANSLLVRFSDAEDAKAAFPQ